MAKLFLGRVTVYSQHSLFRRQ